MDSYNLIIDEGNSFTKIAVIDRKRREVLCEWVKPRFDEEMMEEVVAKAGIPFRAIVSSVRGTAEQYGGIIRRAGVGSVLLFDKGLKLPIGIEYDRTQIGSDRIAAAVGAVMLYGSRWEMLLIDIGSATTIDRIVNGTFVGGNISLGLEMRFKALAAYTEALPEISVTEIANMADATFPTLGQSTVEAMKYGVLQGTFYEVKGYIDHYLKKNGDLRIIFIGGGAEYFVNRIKNTIFAGRNLMFLGLNEILEYNATH